MPGLPPTLAGAIAEARRAQRFGAFGRRSGAVPFVVFEIKSAKRAVNAEEALELVNALFEHTSRANSTLADQLALRIDRELQHAVGTPSLALSPEEWRELLAAMEAAQLGHEERTRLSMLRSAIWSAEITEDEGGA
jgi:hypothetical protein